MTTIETTAPDLELVKRRQQQMWASGDYHAVAALIQPVAETLCDAIDAQAGWSVLDVATGSGNAAIAAARRGGRVVGIDYVASLLARARERAAAEGVTVELMEGDLEAMALSDGSFDAVVSVFGSMFAPDHQRAAEELVRVTRPGGRIGLATWTPDGFIGEMFRTVGAHVPPVPGVASPLLWGTEPYLRELFGEGVDALVSTERTFTFRFVSAEAFVDYFETNYGPTVKAFEAVGDAGREALYADLVGVVGRHVDTGNRPVAIPATWLETIAIRSASYRSS